MGIYDRDYYRDEPPPGGGLFLGRSSAVKVLLTINIAVFLIWFSALITGAGWFQLFLMRNFTTSLESVLHYRVWTLVTYSFSHDMKDIFHLLFNMWGLWFFGKMLEEDIGPRNLIFLYVTSAIVAAALFIGLNLLSGRDQFLIGASGAVVAFAIAVALSHPNRVILVFGLMPLQMKWVGLSYVVFDVAGAMAGRGNVAYSAHLGGAFMGFLFCYFDLRPFDRPGQVDIFKRLRGLFRRKPALRLVPKPEPRERASVEAKPDSGTAARVDELLAKIHREGMGALTEEEKNFLESASQKYRK